MPTNSDSSSVSPWISPPNTIGTADSRATQRTSARSASASRGRSRGTVVKSGHPRSEERRVGKEGRCGRGTCNERGKRNKDKQERHQKEHSLGRETKGR